jgi:hypothetical protein
VLTKLERLLHEHAHDGWDVHDDEGAVVVNAHTHQAFSNAADAHTAAEGLVASITDLGYELTSGTIGSELPATSDGHGSWRGRLLELVLKPSA